jgi:hypothetical protein
MRCLFSLLGWFGWVACVSSSPDAKVKVAPDQPSSSNLFSNDPTGSMDSASSAAPPSCLGEKQQAEVIGLDMYLMIDISGSMTDALPGTGQAPVQTKWDAVKQSLEAFVQAPESAELGVGLQYFPPSQAGLPSSCSANADCGDSALCTASSCVSQRAIPDPLGSRREVTFFQNAAAANCLGPQCLCSSDADCSSGATCRSMPGACVISGLDFLPPPFPLPVSCNTTADCTGLGLQGVACEPLELCELQLNGGLVPCTPSIGCPAGAGTCQTPVASCLSKSLCDPTGYSTPAVAISTDPGRSQQIIASLESIVPKGSTPTVPALTGALQQAQSWAAAHPDRQAITVLATDGFPDSCDAQQQNLENQQQATTQRVLQQGIQDVAQIAAQANSGAHPVRTFVIGVFGANDLGTNGQQNLDSWAQAGGTQNAFVINTSNGNVAQNLLQALNRIRTSAVSCQFKLTSNGPLDFDKVNLVVNDGNGASTNLSNVGDSSACGQDQGWYYVRDPDGTPTQIEVCPSTCAGFSKVGVTADLEVGCATRIR